MSKFDLEKKSAKINDLLVKKGVKKAPIMRVGAALDISGSMERIIRSGHLQASLDQLMGAAMRFDDNGELDVFKFDTTCEYVGVCKPDNHGDYVVRNRIAARGGTNYAPVITETMKYFFGEEKKSGFFGMGKKTVSSDVPAMVLIITDGEPGDAAETARAIKASSSKSIYYHFVGVGGTRANFPTIAKLADDFSNVGEVYLPRFDMSDDDVYSQLISDELVEFVGKFAP